MRLLLVIFFAAALKAQSTGTGVITYPSTPPFTGLTGCGTTFVDPTFGIKGVRITCSTFDPAMAGNSNNVYTMSNGGSSDDDFVSTDDRLIIVSNSGTNKYIVAINPQTLQISRPYASATSGCPRGTGNCSTYGGWSNGGQDMGFSRTDPCKVWNMGSSLVSYTFGSDVSAINGNTCSGSISGPPVGVTALASWIENSPAGCTTTGCNCLPADFGTPTWTSEGGTVAGDAYFGEAFSSVNYHNGATTGQGTGFYVAVWNPTKGCISYNTSTGAIQADVGWSGGAGLTCGSTQCTGTSTALGTFTIHNVKFNADGSRLFVTWATCLSGTCTGSVPFTWVTGTTTVYASESTNTSGHWCGGYLGLINDPNSNWYYRTQGTSGPGTPTLVKSLPNFDTHCGWQMANVTDTAPFVWTGVTSSNGYGNLELPYDQPTTPYAGEIDFTDMNGDGLTWREALTYNTGWSPSFDATNNITGAGCDSATTCLVGTSTDGLNQLGDAGGDALSCIPNGPTWKTTQSYAANYVINPAAANNAGNYSYQIASSCVSGSTQPATWNQTIGNTQPDGTCSWINVGVPSGPNKCRADVVVWRTLLSPLPTAGGQGIVVSGGTVN